MDFFADNVVINSDWFLFVNRSFSMFILTFIGSFSGSPTGFLFSYSLRYLLLFLDATASLLIGSAGIKDARYQFLKTRKRENAT